MGRPLGSLNRERPFKVALQMALRERPQSLRLIANRLIDKAEEGDLASIRELIDRLDGKAAQVIDQGPMMLTQLTDSQLLEIAGGLTEADLLALPPPDSKPRNS
jgi:hypothetical protein